MSRVSVISGDGRGSGSNLVKTRAIEVIADDNVLVLDSGLDAVVHVDIVSGDRTIISGKGRGSGPDFV